MLGQVFPFIYFIFYCYTTVSTLYTGEVSLDDYGNKVDVDRAPTINRRKKISAVMFFADTFASGDYHNFTGLDCLKLEKKPEIKHCTDLPRSIFSRKKRNWTFEKHTCTCYARLQDAIISLLHYAQNTLGMVTALGSLSNHSFSNSIRFGNSEINVEDRFESNDIHSADSVKEKPKKESLKVGPQTILIAPNQQEENTNVLSDKDEEQYRKVPLLNVFPKDSPPPFYAFTDEEERKKRSEGPYVFEPEHKEVFKIKTKRDVHQGKPKEIRDPAYLNREPKVNSIFDIMDIMNNMQRSLFSAMLQEESDTYSHGGEPFNFHRNFFGRIRQPGLFEVVQKTLYSVINSSDTGFLMIIIGGNLSDIASSYTPLVQSIKHVAENTEEDSTLFVLTGTCPNSPDAKVKLPCEELNRKNLPLFATGPGSEEFANCYELYDVPLTVKRILSRYNSNNKEAPPQKLELPEQRRVKRSFMDMDEEEEDYDEEEEELHHDPRRAAHTGASAAAREKAKGGCSDTLVHFRIIHLFFISLLVFILI